MFKKFGQRELLKEISLSFYPGAKIGVLGRNGSGKSTLLRIMAGQDKEYEGEAKLSNGFTVGYLSQEPQLDPDKTGARKCRRGSQPHPRHLAPVR